jgi:ABC-type multidrug transport system permease subunit
MVMFTLLIMVTSGAVLLVIERKQGLLRRLASSPMSRTSVMLGKWGGRILLGGVQVGFAMLLGSLLFRMNWGPNVPMLLAVLLAYAGLVALIGIVLGNLARSEGQALAIGVIAANLLGALGGCWWPIEITPPWMQGLALALPTGWAMDAMHKLVSFGDPPAAVLPHIGVLLLASLAVGWLAVRTFRFQ